MKKSSFYEYAIDNFKNNSKNIWNIDFNSLIFVVYYLSNTLKQLYCSNIENYDTNQKSIF
jgi:hypothetical protein